MAKWDFFQQIRSRWRRPDPREMGRTGEARYAPISQTRPRTRVLAPRTSQISYYDLDRARLYPVVVDALAALRTPIVRANFHFACDRPEIADLAQDLLADHINSLMETLMRGGMEFGYQVVEIVWEPRFNLVVSTAQGEQGGGITREYPYAWGISRFKAFSPFDTHLLLDHRGHFGGIRQYVRAEHVEIAASKLIHFAPDTEFDQLYGIPRTRPAIPFVEIAESVLDDLARYSRSFAVPYKIGRHRSGQTSVGNGQYAENSVLMREALEALESGSAVSLPAEYDESGHPLWDINIVQAPGENRYAEHLAFIHQVIRMALMVPEMASSQAPDTGTYNLGETQIDLFLTNLEGYLDGLRRVLNEQLLARWTAANFGPDAPPVKILFEPIDIKIRRALLGAMLKLLEGGLPVTSPDGQEYGVDWTKLAGDYGVRLEPLTLRDRAEALQRAISGLLNRPDFAAPTAQEPTQNADNSLVPRRTDPGDSADEPNPDVQREGGPDV